MFVVENPDGHLHFAKLSKQVWEAVVPVYLPGGNSEHTHTDGFWPSENAKQVCQNNYTNTTNIGDTTQKIVYELFNCFDQIFECQEIEEWNLLKWHWPQVSENPVPASFGNVKEIKLEFKDENEHERNTFLRFVFEIHRLEDSTGNMIEQPVYAHIFYNSPIALDTEAATNKIKTAMLEPEQNTLRGNIINHSWGLDANVSQYII
jgi:hypothetical protein